jgi:hypothetical protein
VDVGIDGAPEGAAGPALALPPGYSRLARSPGFVAAVQRAFDAGADGHSGEPAADVVIELPA